MVISLCFTKNLTVVLLRSVRFWQKVCSSCIGSSSVRLAIPCTLTRRPFLCFPSSLALHHRWFSPVHPFHAGIQCRCCQFLVLGGQMLRRSTNVRCSVRNCHMWHGRLHIRQYWCVAGFQPGSRVPVAQNSSKVGANAAIVHLSPRLGLPASQKKKKQMPTSRVNVATKFS